jgi:PAS domain S-box-containing protein
MNNNVPSASGLLGELDTEGMLNSLPDGAYITNRDRQIIFWNRAAERITGWKKAEVVNRTCYDNILSHVDKDGHCLCGHEYCPLHRAIVTEQSSREPVLVFAQTKSGSRTPVEVTVAPICNRAGEVIGGIETFRDLTESMENQLQAKGVQELALHCDLPADERVQFDCKYQARDVIGGDFYRIERLGATQYAILLADAVGHGVSAALGTMSLRSLWDDHRERVTTPGAFLQVINASVHKLVQQAGYFGTALAVVYDAATGELRCVRAGHPAPLLFRANGQIESVGKSNPALGMFAQATYQETTAWLEPGDVMLLFTDGATEVVGPADHDLGKEGLKRLVQEQLNGAPPAQLDLARLEEQLLKFSGAVRLADDLTLLKILRRS